MNASLKVLHVVWKRRVDTYGVPYVSKLRLLEDLTQQSWNSRAWVWDRPRSADYTLAEWLEVTALTGWVPEADPS